MLFHMLFPQDSITVSFFFFQLHLAIIFAMSAEGATWYFRKRIKMLTRSFWIVFPTIILLINHEWYCRLCWCFENHSKFFCRAWILENAMIWHVEKVILRSLKLVVWNFLHMDKVKKFVDEVIVLFVEFRVHFQTKEENYVVVCQPAVVSLQKVQLLLWMAVLPQIVHLAGVYLLLWSIPLI